MAVQSGMEHCVVKGNVTLGSSENVDGKCFDGVLGMTIVVYFDTNFDPEECEACNREDLASKGGDYEFCAYQVEIPCEPVSVECGEPSAEPSIAPTKAPVSFGEVDCPKDLDVLYQQGNTDIDPTKVVKILNQYTSEVHVVLRQGWEESDAFTIDHMYYTYRTDYFNEKCYNARSVFGGTIFDDIIIQCFVTKPFAVLEICVVDDSMNGNATVPECCDPKDPPEKSTVCYTIKINCKTECDFDDDPVPELVTVDQNRGSPRFDL